MWVEEAHSLRSISKKVKLNQITIKKILHEYDLSTEPIEEY